MSTEPTLSAYSLVRYHRRGFAACTKPDVASSIADQAQDCEALLRHLGVQRAHVVGHSYGGVIALQLAMQAPELVHTLVLEEPALLAVPSGEAFFGEMAPIVETYGAGDKEGAVRAFLRWSDGPTLKRSSTTQHRAVSTRPSRMRTRSSRSSSPASGSGRSLADEAKSIDAPVLFVLGQDSLPMFHEGRDLVRSWLPQTEVAIIPDVCHLLQMENPAAVGEALASSFLDIRCGRRTAARYRHRTHCNFPSPEGRDRALDTCACGKPRTLALRIWFRAQSTAGVLTRFDMGRARTTLTTPRRMRSEPTSRGLTVRSCARRLTRTRTRSADRRRSRSPSAAHVLGDPLALQSC